jgi:hypothetical protein
MGVFIKSFWIDWKAISQLGDQSQEVEVSFLMRLVNGFDRVEKDEID